MFLSSPRHLPSPSPSVTPPPPPPTFPSFLQTPPPPGGDASEHAVCAPRRWPRSRRAPLTHCGLRSPSSSLLFLRCGRNSEAGKARHSAGLPVVSPFCSICLSALFIKRRSSSHARTLTHLHTLTQMQTGCILYVFKLLSDILFCLSGAERHGSTFIPGLRALASIPHSAACIILARCPDYASAASRASLDRVSFLFTLLVFLFISLLRWHTLPVRSLGSRTYFCIKIHCNQFYVITNALPSS